ncbi:autotransporter assembly complex protein TamA [Tropicimonas sediminicola]|uniref:Autotransporter secretion outer membrane protein TamA n=1 Tax=Tropicimonas sediminicola TaxID=1031541 RepID=A0A239HYG3_9RHOB|nr:autotransporter assembly complex family protein [Tropicimonas sediminicola]SNS86427.1 autotransporter secretion outer membrane protein TamA [Tropicimonas sediminicola]
MRKPKLSLTPLGTAMLLTVVALPAAALETVTVNVIGGDEELQKELQGSSKLMRTLDEQQAAEKQAQRKRFWQRNQETPEPPTSSEVLATARAEYKQMISVLYGEGYYGGVINVTLDGREAADISPLNAPANIRNAVITVRPGPIFKFSEASVGPLAPETEIPEGYARGEIAQSSLISDAARTATTAWRDAGHAKADLAAESITANHGSSTISSRLTVEPGPRLRFGPTVVSGNQRVRTERVVAIAGIPTGEVYSPDEVNDAAERLRRSGAFRSVSLREAEVVGPGDQIAIETNVLEDKRRRIGAGAEISTQEGGRFNAYWMHRNLFGGAENLRFDLDIENIGTTVANNGVDYILSGVLRRPATFRPDTDVFFGGYIEHEDEPGYLADTAEIGGGLTWIVSDTFELTAGLNYRASSVEDAFGERDYQMISFPLNLEWDTRDEEFDATEGFYVDTTLTPFAGIVDMPNGGLLELDARTYWGFGEKRNTVLAGRMQFGSLYGPEISEAPADYLFFAGGGGSVRGQPYQSLGTGEIDDTIIGGRSYVALSGEIRSYVRGNLGVVGFIDAGYVGAEEFYDGSGSWMSGGGIGVRYKTGFGPIRVDIATPIDGGPDDADSVQLYIGIGQAF